ncbi:MAG: class II glutamine amidotransferase [Candidatus Thorarchaeota archaeon]
MCDLLGMSFNSPVKASISLNIFQLRGSENPDGWGLAFYEGDILQIVKEARASTQSPLYDFVENYPQSQTFISHVRRSTMGNRSYANTHPFYRVGVIGGNRREFSFAHNGTLTNMDPLSLTKYRPIGETDSERLFCYLLETIEANSINHPSGIDFGLLHETLREINGLDNTLNCILSDGRYLLCYSDENRHNGGLRFAQQEHPFGELGLKTDELDLGLVDIRSANIVSDHDEKPSGYVVVTRAMAGEIWTDFDPGQLVVFHQGSLLYRSTN